MSEGPNRTYKIIIETNGGGGGNGAGGAQNAIAGSTADTNPAKGAIAQTGSTAGEKAMSALKRVVSYKTLKSFAVQQINHAVSLVELKTGSKEEQQYAAAYNSIIQTAVSWGETIAAGAIVGNGVGAVVGLAIGVTHSLVDLSNRAQTLDYQERLDSRSIAMKSARAGTNGSRSGNQ